MNLTYAQLDPTPLGPISFVAGDHGLHRVAFSTIIEVKQAHRAIDAPPSHVGFETLKALIVEVHDYLIGRQQSFSAVIDWDMLDAFQRQVLSLTLEIPYGQVLTYGQLAAKLGKPGAARAVGTALARNPMPIVIPCHRVIGADHRLHGYIGGEDSKAFLLALEGHALGDGRVLSGKRGGG